MYPKSPVFGAEGSEVFSLSLENLNGENIWSHCAVKAKELGVDMVICGPEAPLVEGAEECFRDQNILFWGPSQKAAQLEGSKAFAKNIMKEAGIPTANYQEISFEDNPREQAYQYVQKYGAVVLKASGLAQGKGVFVCKSIADIDAAHEHFASPSMLEASKTIILEECLIGRECSYFALVSGQKSMPLGFAVDFKRLNDGDEGPNTGGMGAYTPVPWLPAHATNIVEQQIMTPLLKTLAKHKIDYVGTLYVGLMWTLEGPKVIEFNVRFGDPEAQVLCFHDDRDWGSLILNSLKPKEDNGAGDEAIQKTTQAPNKVTVGVVMAAEGYPYNTPKQKSAVNPALNQDFGAGKVFFGGVERNGDQLVAAKGRVCTVVFSGSSFEEARAKAYSVVEKYVWPGAVFRRDIAKNIR